MRYVALTMLSVVLCFVFLGLYHRFLAEWIYYCFTHTLQSCVIDDDWPSASITPTKMNKDVKSTRTKPKHATKNTNLVLNTIIVSIMRQ